MTTRGQAMAEVALLTPFVMLLLLGLIEVGRFALFSIEVANSAHAGVQYGAQDSVTGEDPGGMQSAAIADASNLNLTAGNVNATTFCRCADGSASTCLPTDCATSHREQFASVTVSDTFTGLFTIPGIPHTFTVTKTATMQIPQ